MAFKIPPKESVDHLIEARSGDPRSHDVGHIAVQGGEDSTPVDVRVEHVPEDQLPTPVENIPTPPTPEQ